MPPKWKTYICPISRNVKPAPKRHGKKDWNRLPPYYYCNAKTIWTAVSPAFVKGDVKDEEDALKGARDIIAEQVSEDERARNQLRNQFSRQAVITSKVVKGKEEEAAKYRDYFDFSEPLKRCSSHRLLAIRRGESEGLLKVSISPDDEECAGRLEQMYVRGNNECSRQVGEAVRDAYKRLLKPSIETEFSALSKEKADEEAIRVFAGNLRQLLLAPPWDRNGSWELIPATVPDVK